MTKTTLLFFITLSLAQNSFTAEVDLFILAGQSNAQGWSGNGKQFPKATGEIDKAIRFYWLTPTYSSSNGKWTYLKPQGGRYQQGHFGPEVTLARALKNKGFNPAIFKYTLGATSIGENWKLPGQKGMYDQMVNELTKARSLLEKQGNTVHLRSFIWIQGESDAKNIVMAKAYYQNLKTIIKDVRINLANDINLPVILGVDEQFSWFKNYPQIVQAQNLLADEDSNIIFTSMIGLEKADATHLTPKGLELHGIRIFTAYMDLVNSNKN